MREMVGPGPREIRMGIQGECSLCPIALSLHRIAKKNGGNVVYASPTILIAGYWHARTPTKIADWMYEYDRTGIGQPFLLAVDFEVTE